MQHTRKEPTERMDSIFPDALPELIDTIELRFHIPKGARAKAAGSLLTVAGTPTGTSVAEYKLDHRVFPLHKQECTT